VTRKRAEMIALRVIDWCSKEYGWSEYHRKKSVLLEIQYQSDTHKGTYGEFDREEIMIYVFTRTNRSVRCLVNTVIHEYQHYLQCPQWVSRYIEKYGDGWKNPYEYKAETVADSDTKKCMMELKFYHMY